MTAPDSMASCTLALLYMSQGHERKARQVVRAVLDANPFEGTALELFRRLNLGNHAGVTLDVDTDTIVVAWRRATIASSPGLHVVLLVDTASAHGPARRIDSCRCDGPRGTWKTPRPASGGAAVACIAHITRSGFTPISVARSVAWSPAG